MKFGNRVQWGSARPLQTNLRMVHAPVMSWRYARTVELPIGPDYRVHYDSRFITEQDFPFVRDNTRPQGGKVTCWIGPAPAMHTPPAQDIEQFTRLAGVGPEQYPAMARTGSAVPYQDAPAYPPDAVAVRIDLPSEEWSTIGNGHPNKRGVGAASALEAIYEHAGLLDVWDGSAPERAAMSERLDIHLEGQHLRVITGGESPRDDFGVTCVGHEKKWMTIPLDRQPVGLVLFALVQLVVVALAIACVKLRLASRRRVMDDDAPPALA